jgi:hypothetical protein
VVLGWNYYSVTTGKLLKCSGGELWNMRLCSVHIGLYRALERCRVENILHNVHWMQNWHNSKITIWGLYNDWSKNSPTISNSNDTLLFSQNTPHQNTPHQNTPHQNTPHQGIPHQNKPHESTPHQNTPHQIPLLSDAVVTFFSSIATLIANGRFLDCATIAFGERYRTVLAVTCWAMVKNVLLSMC